MTEQAKVSDRPRAKLYAILHRYWAGNFSKNALLPDYWRSGAKGQDRKQKCKLGRPNAKVRAENGTNKGYSLSDIDKKKLRYGWRYFLSAGRSCSQAYLETMAVFYSERWEVQDGAPVPILLETDLRPTPAQFRRWGPDGDPRLTVSRIQLGEIDWSKKYRGISGSATDGLVAVGMQAVCDTTTNDVYLKSVRSRLKTVGSVNRLLITESKSGLIIGLHCGFDAPSARTFLLAVAHAALSKVEFCARFGITIADEEWPSCTARTYLGDNGEYRNEMSQKALSQFKASIDYIPSGQPQFNGIAESKHHVFHARLDHTLDGTTNGQPRRRGKAHPAIDACVNYYEYMRELICEILYHNNQEPVPHLLSTEMRRALVPPTRIAVYRWLTENGYVVDFNPSVNLLRAHLYPSLPATLTESGVYLLREDCGDREQQIPNVRYMGDCLIQSGLLEQVRRTGHRRITVRGDPTDPRSVWIQTALGLSELHNIYPDPILFDKAPLADLISMNDDDKVAELESRGKDEQIRIAIVSKRQTMLKNARVEKKLELAALPKPMTKVGHYAEIDSNRHKEILLLRAQAAEFSAQQSILPDAGNAHNKETTGMPPDAVQFAENVKPSQAEVDDGVAEDPAMQALIKYLKAQA